MTQPTVVSLAPQDEPQARVEVRTTPDGTEQLVLVDPAADGMVRAVKKHGCKAFFDTNLDRMTYFAQRMRVRGDDPKDVCITLICANDPVGSELADLLMPEGSMQAIRDAGQIPIARGLAARPGLIDAVALFDAEAAEKLRTLEGPVVLVVSEGVADVFPAPSA